MILGKGNATYLATSKHYNTTSPLAGRDSSPATALNFINGLVSSVQAYAATIENATEVNSAEATAVVAAITNILQGAIADVPSLAPLSSVTEELVQATATLLITINGVLSSLTNVSGAGLDLGSLVSAAASVLLSLNSVAQGLLSSLQALPGLGPIFSLLGPLLTVLTAPVL